MMENHLIWGGVDTVQIARKFGTPLYVIDAEAIERNWREIHDVMVKHHQATQICYAYKANTHLALCKLLSELGAGAEVASGGELHAALKISVPANRIVFDGPNKSMSELRTAINAGVMINADSLTELGRIQYTAKNLGKKARVGIRVNPAIRVETHPHLATAMREHKFGLLKDALLEACSYASQQDMIELLGLHAHLGSQIHDIKPFDEAFQAVLELSGELLEKFNLKIQILDLGGGLGISYTGNEVVPSLDEFAGTLSKRLQEKMGKRASEITIILELGRRLVANAGILLTEVGVVKRNPVTNWALVDAGMNDLIRPALYGAYHNIEVANKLNSSSRHETYSIGGPCCESDDVLGRDRKLPHLEERDILAVKDVGAYGFTMSSNYNSYPRPLVLLAKNGRVQIIRERESYDDVFRLERLPTTYSALTE